MNPEFLMNCSYRFMYKTWMEGTYDDKKATFLRDTCIAEMQIISYSFIILEHIQID